MRVSYKSVVLNGLSWSGSTKIFITILQLFQFGFLGRFYSAQDFAIIAIVMMLFNIGLTTIDAGISSAIIAHDDIDEKERSSLYWFNAIITLIVSTALFSSLPLIAEFYGIENNLILLQAYVLTFLIIPLGQPFQAYFQKDLNFKLLTIIEVIANSLDVIICMVIVLFGYAVWGFVFGKIVYWVVRSVLLFIFGMKKWRISFYFSIKKVMPFLNFGLNQMLSGYVFFLFTQMPKFIIPKFLGIELLGYYELVNRITIQPLLKITPVFRQVIFPVFSRMKSDSTRINSGFQLYVSNFSLLIALLTIFIMVFPYLYIPLVFGNKWNVIIPTVILSSLGMYIRSINETSGTLAFGLGRADLELKRTIFNLIIVYPLGILGAKAWGLNGVVCAIILTHLMSLIYEQLFIVKPLISSSWDTYFIPTFITVSFLSLIVFSEFFIPQPFRYIVNVGIALIFIMFNFRYFQNMHEIASKK